MGSSPFFPTIFMITRQDLDDSFAPLRYLTDDELTAERAPRFLQRVQESLSRIYRPFFPDETRKYPMHVRIIAAVFADDGVTLYTGTVISPRRFLTIPKEFLTNPEGYRQKYPNGLVYESDYR
jgi:hypothetical protein